MIHNAFFVLELVNVQHVKVLLVLVFFVFHSTDFASLPLKNDVFFQLVHWKVKHQVLLLVIFLMHIVQEVQELFQDQIEQFFVSLDVLYLKKIFIKSTEIGLNFVYIYIQTSHENCFWF